MTMARPSWRVLPADEGRVVTLSEALGLRWPIARLLVARGLADPADAGRFLGKSMADLQSPFELSGMDRAAARLARAVRDREKILVHGDFDADGITAAALLSLFLKELGADASPFVPNRLVEGHGIAPRAVALARETGVRLVVTCDCGTSSACEIGELARAGIETIVTDHHAIPGELPAEAILVNPKLGAANGAQDDLSGVGVAFMLAVALRSTLRDAGFFADRAEPNLKGYLDVVALGTLADMAALRGQNRILVAHGLRQIALSRRPGLVAMRDGAGLADAPDVGAADVGFRLAPRLNAAARLGHADEALELLLTEDPSRAERLAASLEAWNRERRSRQETMTRLAAIEAARQVESGAAAVVVASRDFHPGIIGLVAQKLSQEFGRPAFVFAIEGETARGSGRSRGADLIGAIEACADLFLHFGGHREAGGGSLPADRIPEFRRRFEETLRKQGFAASQEVLIDAELNLRHVNEEILRSLEQLGPFGIGNPEPVFLARARVLGLPREVGRGHLRVTLSDEGGGLSFPAIGFGLWGSSADRMSGAMEVAYFPEVNLYQGRREVQLRLQGLRDV